ncbi:MAG TPA: hypothetical protein VGH13_17420 [Xanthobacteraceae bacterium]|jgi:hypothetical protein
MRGEQVPAANSHNERVLKSTWISSGSRLPYGNGTRTGRRRCPQNLGRKTMDGDNRTPDKTIGEVKYAQDQAARTIEQQREKEDVRSNPKQDPAKKKTGEF